MNELSTKKASVSFRYLDDKDATEEMGRILSEVAHLFYTRVAESKHVVGILAPVVEIER